MVTAMLGLGLFAIQAGPVFDESTPPQQHLGKGGHRRLIELGNRIIIWQDRDHSMQN
jgi:hypothetical protein